MKHSNFFIVLLLDLKVKPGSQVANIAGGFLPRHSRSQVLLCIKIRVHYGDFLIYAGKRCLDPAFDGGPDF